MRKSKRERERGTRNELGHGGGEMEALAGRLAGKNGGRDLAIYGRSWRSPETSPYIIMCPLFFLFFFFFLKGKMSIISLINWHKKTHLPLHFKPVFTPTHLFNR